MRATRRARTSLSTPRRGQPRRIASWFLLVLSCSVRSVVPAHPATKRDKEVPNPIDRTRCVCQDPDDRGRENGDMTDQWHRPLRHVRGADLSGNTGQTSGMTRLEAISGRTVGSEKLWMGRTHVDPGASSGDHHHGDTETA